MDFELTIPSLFATFRTFPNLKMFLAAIVARPPPIDHQGKSSQKRETNILPMVAIGSHSFHPPAVSPRRQTMRP